MSVLWKNVSAEELQMDHVCPAKVTSKIALNLSEMFLINQPESMKSFSLNFLKILFPDNSLRNFYITP